MDADVAIRTATTDDLDSIVTLWSDLVAGQRSHDSHILAAENESAARDVLSRYVVVNDVVVAEATETSDWSAGVIVGFAMYHLEEGLYEMDVTRGVVENIYVIPTARGRGIGSALMERAEDDLREDGADTIILSVMATNRRALEFYRERGYEDQRIVLERALDGESSE